MSISQKQRDLVSLFPQFLTARRRGWAGLQDFLQSSGLERPHFFLLKALVEETDPGEKLSRQEIESRLFNPYATFNQIFDALPLLVEKGYLLHTDNSYLVKPRGRALMEQTEQAARNYVATLTPLPLPELTSLAALLEEIAQRMWQANEPAIKAHQARAHRLPPILTTAPMVHLEAAIFALWMARDDAHIAAWRAKGLSGPQMDLLSHLAAGEVQTLPALTEALQHSQHPEDVVRGVASLTGLGYVLVEGERVTLTEAGWRLRGEIEEETDRVYFAPWPPLSENELDGIYSSLKSICEALRM